MIHVQLKIKLTLIGPILTQSSVIGKLGIDAPMARNHAGEFYLPFSLVRGRLRQSLEELSTAGVALAVTVDELLGSPSFNDGNEPQRARLRFSDFVCETSKIPEELQFRIRMDPERGAVDQGAMQILESPFGAGQLVTFAGEIAFFAENENKATASVQTITLGLRWITNFGAERTSGFGRIAKVEVQQLGVDDAIAASSIGDKSKLFMELSPREPFCVSRKKLSPNLFESDTVFSGGVLKGALASTLRAVLGWERNQEIKPPVPAPWSELGAYFDKIRFAHAFPAQDAAGKRPVVFPLSLVKARYDEKDLWLDVALCSGPVLLGTPQKAPEFCVDWKEDSDVLKEFGWGKLNRELRVRTAIDRDRRRAKDENLFAYDLVIPHGFKWHTHADLSEITDSVMRNKVAAQLHELLKHDLHYLGKTKARAKVIFREHPTAAVFPSTLQPIEDNLWVITLQTPALLCDPWLLKHASDDKELYDAYNDVWTELAKDSMTLERFFAQQSLVGGYLTYRFQRNSDSAKPKPYNPFLLTDAGSVFVLKVRSNQMEEAKAKILSWEANGLPLPKWAIERYGDHWSTCPFRRQDGFGEIAVNLSCHTERKPKETPFHVLTFRQESKGDTNS